MVLLRVVVGVLLMAHGLVHLLYLAPDVTEFSRERSSLLSDPARRSVAYFLNGVHRDRVRPPRAGGRIDRQRRWLQAMTGLMIGLTTLVNAVSAARLVAGILTAGKTFDSAGQLLLIGAVVFLTNVLAFALWFWDQDGGGPAARAAGSAERRNAFAFPEMTVPEMVRPGWYPQFVDYLALSFNTATAFGPTDVAAIRPWAKLMMMAEASISLALATLVVARAVNIR